MGRVEGAEDKVEKLYPAHDQMEDLLKEDEVIFKNAVFSATREFLSLKTAPGIGGIVMIVVSAAASRARCAAAPPRLPRPP